MEFDFGCGSNIMIELRFLRYGLRHADASENWNGILARSSPDNSRYVFLLYLFIFLHVQPRVA
jgi:hypothetical protein